MNMGRYEHDRADRYKISGDRNKIRLTGSRSVRQGLIRGDMDMTSRQGQDQVDRDRN